MTTQKERWSPYFEYWEDLSVEAAKLIFQQSEKRFLDTVENHKNITTRAYTMLSIIITVLSVLITFFAARLVSISDTNLASVIIACAVVVAAIWCFVLLVQLIFPRRYMAPGSEPKNLMMENYLSYPKEEQLLVWLYSEIEQLQIKIDFNESLAETRFKKQETIIRVGTITLFLVLGALMAIALFNLL